MTTPATHPFTVYRGTTDPFRFKIQIADPDNPGQFIPMELTDLRLTIKCGSDDPFTKSLENGDFVLADAETGEYVWTPEPADTRLFKTGTKDDGTGKNLYELEVRNANATPPSQMVYLVGSIIGLGGLNTDE